MPTCWQRTNYKTSHNLANWCGWKLWKSHRLWKNAQNWEKKAVPTNVLLCLQAIHDGWQFYFVMKWSERKKVSWKKISNERKKKKKVITWQNYLWGYCSTLQVDNVLPWCSTYISYIGVHIGYQIFRQSVDTLNNNRQTDGSCLLFLFYFFFLVEAGEAWNPINTKYK